MFNKSEILKTGVVVVGSFSVGKVVNNIIEFTTPIGSTLCERIALKVGSFIIGSVVTDVCYDKFDKQVGAIIEKVNEVKKSKKLTNY